MVGRKYEAGGIAKDGAKMVMAVANAEVGGWAGGSSILLSCLSKFMAVANAEVGRLL